MSAYEDALGAMHELLTNVGERTWADWTGEDLKIWRSSKSVQHHLSAYGGMGSFNDVLLRANSHRLTAEQEPWAGTLFDELQSICYGLASNGGQDLSSWKIAQSMGSKNAHVQGWRCLDCGFAEASPMDIEWYLAKVHTRPRLLKALDSCALRPCARELMAIRIEGIDRERSRVLAALEASGIKIREREGWMRPCPSCQAENTAVYRWVPGDRKGRRFEPAQDNLPISDSAG